MHTSLWACHRYTQINKANRRDLGCSKDWRDFRSVLFNGQDWWGDGFLPTAVVRIHAIIAYNETGI